MREVPYNDSNSPITGWQVSWQQNGGSTVANAWSAKVSGDNPYTATDMGWNGALAPLASVKFGFQGTGNDSTGTILGCVAEGDDSGSSRSSAYSSSSSSSSGSSSSSISSSSISSSSSSSVAGLYPNYNTSPVAADMTGMESTAVDMASRITLGWNIGNTLETIGGENAWGNPMISNSLIALVKQNGFDAIRIPASWDQYANQTTAAIGADWLDRVKDVVALCLENDMPVILNIHWDGGWLENNITPEKQVENNAKQRAFWQQMATHLRDFDERLMFAGSNEPNVDDAEQMAVLMSYQQTFVDAIRETGGKNAYRILVIQGNATHRTTFRWRSGLTFTIARLLAQIRD